MERHFGYGRVDRVRELYRDLRGRSAVLEVAGRDLPLDGVSAHRHGAGALSGAASEQVHAPDPAVPHHHLYPRHPARRRQLPLMAVAVQPGSGVPQHDLRGVRAAPLLLADGGGHGHALPRHHEPVAGGRERRHLPRGAAGRAERPARGGGHAERGTARPAGELPAGRAVLWFFGEKGGKGISEPVGKYIYITEYGEERV